MKHDILTADLSKTAKQTVNHPILKFHPNIHLNLRVSSLIEEALKNREGILTDTGAFMCDTGKFTGRSPKDKFTADCFFAQTPCRRSGDQLPLLPFQRGERSSCRDSAGQPVHELPSAGHRFLGRHSHRDGNGAPGGEGRPSQFSLADKGRRLSEASMSSPSAECLSSNSGWSSTR